jgi:hypothetical protein
METITISKQHSSQKDESINVKAQGTNPVFSFIWINDECYTLSKGANGKTFSLKKTK